MLLDCSVMNGPHACRKMRELGCSSFVAGVTGNLLPEDVAHFKNCGANAVLPKPFKMATLEQLWIEYGVNGRGGSEHDEENEADNMMGSGNNNPDTVSFNMESMEP
jgi:CheY-like chemotaxis protein